MEAAVGQSAIDELAKSVVETVDALDGGGWGRGTQTPTASARHVDKHPEAVGDVLVESAFQSQVQRRHRAVPIELARVALDPDRHRSGWDEATDGGHDMQDAIGGGCDLDEAQAGRRRSTRPNGTFAQLVIGICRPLDVDSRAASNAGHVDAQLVGGRRLTAPLLLPHNGAGMSTVSTANASTSSTTSRRSAQRP